MVPDTVTAAPPLDRESTMLNPSTHNLTYSLCVTLIVCTPAVVGWKTALYLTEYLQQASHRPSEAICASNDNIHFISSKL
jgi:hypothetical protein